MQTYQQQQQKQLPFTNTCHTFHIISFTINHILTLSQQQIKLNIKMASSMNPYTSVKVSSLINEIGQLIYQQAQQSDNLNPHKVSILREVQETNLFPKDNMFTTGASLIANRSSTFIENQKDQVNSVNSFNTTFSKPRTKTITSNPQNNIHRQTKQQSLPQNFKLLKNKKSQTQLINLRPSSKSGRSRSSAFDTSNHDQQKILQQAIDQFRDQKIIQQQAKQKCIQNKKKMTTLLSKEEMILSFGYQGDYIKIGKRQFNSMMEKKGNVKMAQSILVPGNYKFWKTKQNFKDKNQTAQNFNQTKLSTGIKNDSKFKTPNKQPRENQFKRTTIQTINEMKKNSIEVSNKRVLKPDSQEKVNFQQYKKNLQDRGDSSYTYKSNKPLTEQQLKAKNHKMQFLTNKLSQYHQKPQNQMTQWIQNVQDGCKVRIFVGQKQSCQNLLPNKYYDSQTLKQSKNKENRSHSQPRKKIQHNLSLNEDLGMQLKCISNLKAPQREDSDLISEWQKRKLIKTVEVRQDESKNNKGFNKNLHTSRKGKSLQHDNSELTRSITDGHMIRLSSPKNTQKFQKGKSLSRQMQNKKYNDNQISQLPQLKATYSQQKASQDPTNHFPNNFSASSKKQSIINLNLQQFKIVKGYLQSKNIIFQKKQSISKYRTQSILENKKVPLKKGSKNNQLSDFDSESAKLLTTSNQEKIDGNNDLKNILDENNGHSQLKSNKNVTFLQINKFSINTQKKIKNQGTINVTNQRLKNSLLGSTSQIFISPSSILYTKNKSQNRGNSLEVSELQKISQSQKIFLPLQSQKKSIQKIEQHSRAHSQSFKQAFSLQIQKSANKKLAIIQRKHHSTVLKENLLVK